MTNVLDPAIREDLRALAADSRRAIPPLGDSSLTPYRDNSQGARAARQEERNRRNLQLALMPLRLERVFVHRASRIGGAAAALLVVGGVLALSNPVALSVALALGLPPSPGFVAAGGSLLVLAGYIVAGWFAERYFEERVGASLDITDSTEGLVAGPLDQATTLVRRLDAWAVAVPLLAIVVSVPLAFFLLLVFEGGLTSNYVYAFSEYEIYALFESNMLMVLGAIAAVAAPCAWLAFSVHQSHTRPQTPPLLRFAEHWGLVPLSVTVAIAYAVFSTQTIADHSLRMALPSEAYRFALALGGTLVIALPSIWVVFAHRRREESQIAVAEISRGNP